MMNTHFTSAMVDGMKHKNHGPKFPYPIVAEGATAAGYRTLWTVFALMTLATLSYMVLGARVAKSNRIYHYITAMITGTAALAYYAMASQGGSVFVHVGKAKFREVFYARYIDWAITTPMLLLDLALVAGIPGIDIISLVFADLVMVFTGLFGSLGVHSNYRWGWFVIGCVAYLYIIYTLLMTGRRHAKSRSNKVSVLFTNITVYTLLLWTLYPVAWALSEGIGMLSVNQEILFYAVFQPANDLSDRIVLDVLAKGVFGLWLLVSHMNIPESGFPLRGYWGSGAGAADDADESDA